MEGCLAKLGKLLQRAEISATKHVIVQLKRSIEGKIVANRRKKKMLPQEGLGNK
jgi:hypothetical protein